jgi:predicted nucleic acid-binding protein
MTSITSIRRVYLDASALLQMFLYEKGAGHTHQFLNHFQTCYATSLSLGEALGRLKSKAKREELSVENYFIWSAMLMSPFITGKYVVDERAQLSDPGLFPFAQIIAEKNQPPKAKNFFDLADALQIAFFLYGNAADHFREASPLLVTCDDHLALVARKNGIDVWCCRTEPPPPI